jgi:hypothetical protein
MPLPVESYGDRRYGRMKSGVVAIAVQDASATFGSKSWQKLGSFWVRFERHYGARIFILD